jgi:hypothetical protein
MTDYRATTDQWEKVLGWSEDRDINLSCDAACILELRARVEALEARNKPGFMALSVTTATAPVCRPKPPSLKEQAQAELDRLIALIPTEGAMAMAEPIRKALEALPND